MKIPFLLLGALGASLATFSALEARTATGLSSFGGIEEPHVIYHPGTDTFTTDNFPNITDEGNGRIRMLLRFQASQSWDGDRTTSSKDRGRAEIKVLGPRQKPGETFEYGSTWRTSPGTKVGNRFYHITQVKGYGGPDTGTPLVTTTLRGGNTVRVEYHSASGDDGTARAWSWVDHQWTRSVIRLKISTAADGLLLTSVNGDSFTGVTNKAIYRVDAPEYQPKWGIYRGTDNGTPYGLADYMEHENITAIMGEADPVPTVVAPEFSPAPGVYAQAQTVAITSATAGATIRYTTDGSTPSSAAGAIYSGPIAVSSTKTIKAIAYTSSASSPVATGKYTIGNVTILPFEAESLGYVQEPSSVQVKVDADSGASGGQRLTFNFTAPDQWLDLTLPGVPAGTYVLEMVYRTNNNRGRFVTSVGGAPIGPEIDMYRGSNQEVLPVTLGTVTFASSGEQVVRLAVVGKNAASSSYTGSVDQFTLTSLPEDGEPAIATQPASQSVAPGGQASFSVLASGKPAPVYQWFKYNAAIPGATTPTLSLANVQVGDAGPYHVVVSNSVGATTSAVATLSVAKDGVMLSANPASQSATGGSAVILAVDADPEDGEGEISYQWRREGVAIAGATSASFALPSVQAFHAGAYTVTITAAGGAGSFTSAPAMIEVAAPPASASRLMNLSTRGLARTGDEVIIPGFVVGGTGSKRVLLRAVGPGLQAFGVAEFLPNPRLVLKRRVGDVFEDFAVNDDWGANANAAEIVAAASVVGGFALANGSADAALLLDLPAGVYTAIGEDASGGSGIVLAELYDAGAGEGGARLVNISTRGYVGVGGAIMIPGFVVSPEGPKTFLIRAIGPGLQALGVTGVLADPELVVYRRNIAAQADELILQNNDWGVGADATQTAQAAQQAGAFALTPGSSDAAFVVTLDPGIYTVHARGADGGTGVALVEVYELF